MSVVPLQTFGFLSDRANATRLVRKVLSECIESGVSLVTELAKPIDGVGARESLDIARSAKLSAARSWLRFLDRALAIHPGTTVSIINPTATKLTLIVWHPIGCPSGTSPTLTVPSTGPFAAVLQAIGHKPRLGGYYRQEHLPE